MLVAARAVTICDCWITVFDHRSCKYVMALSLSGEPVGITSGLIILRPNGAGTVTRYFASSKCGKPDFYNGPWLFHTRNNKRTYRRITI